MENASKMVIIVIIINTVPSHFAALFLGVPLDIPVDKRLSYAVHPLRKRIVIISNLCSFAPRTPLDILMRSNPYCNGLPLGKT